MASVLESLLSWSSWSNLGGGEPFDVDGKLVMSSPSLIAIEVSKVPPPAVGTATPRGTGQLIPIIQTDTNKPRE